MASVLVATEVAETISNVNDVLMPRLARLGTLADIAGTTVFLASDETPWVTGKILNVDGGGLIYDSHSGQKTKPAHLQPLASDSAAGLPR